MILQKTQIKSPPGHALAQNQGSIGSILCQQNIYSFAEHILESKSALEQICVSWQSFSSKIALRVTSARGGNVTLQTSEVQISF